MIWASLFWAAELTAREGRLWGTVALITVVSTGLLLFAWLLKRASAARSAPTVDTEVEVAGESTLHLTLTAVAMTAKAAERFSTEMAVSHAADDTLEGLHAHVEALLHQHEDWVLFGYGDTHLTGADDALESFGRTQVDFARRMAEGHEGASDHSRLHLIAFLTLTRGLLRGLSRLDDREQAVQCLQARLALPPRGLIKFHAFPSACVISKELFGTRFPEMEHLSPKP